MSSSQKNLSDYSFDSIPSGSNKRIAIVTAEWNDKITGALRTGAYDTLIQHGVHQDDIIQHYVPGTFELTLGAQWMFDYKNVDAVIALGCVIQGETRHFDFICHSVTQGITDLNIKYQKPVIFGVLTTDDLQQAIDRSGGKHGNKGVEAAVTALKMLGLKDDIQY